MLAEVTYNIANSLLFVVPFAYLDKKHVHIFIDNKEINSYIWQTNTSILLEELSGKKLLIKRNTPLSDYSFRFIEATALTAEVLNIIYLQHLYVLEELNDLIDKIINNPELIGNLKLQIDKLKAQEKAVNDNIKKIKELIQNTNKNIADKIRDNNKIVSKVNDLLKKVSDTLKEIKKIHGDITSKNSYPLKIFNADSTKHIVIAPDEAITKNYNLTLPEDAPKDDEVLKYDASKKSFVWAKPAEEKKEFIELNSKSGHQVRIYPAANLQKDMKINLGDDVFKLCSSIDKTTENKLTAEINTNKKDISALETSIINEVKELTGVDDGLRNDVDINTAAIVKLKQSGGTTTTSNVSLATETTAGVAEIATQQEANNGTDDSRIVTPKKLKTITRDLDSRATRIRNDVDRNTAAIVKLKQNGGTTTTSNVSLATETTAGKAEIATQQEATDGTDDSRIVTPRKLKGITDNLIKDRTTLEASIRTKLTQLDGVDSDLRKDTDGNTSDIAQLKATETADIKGVIDKITKLTATDTGGVATLTKAISDLAKKEKSDIAGIKTQQQTNTTAINDLKNKTVTLIDASESTKGVAEIATQQEATDGTDDSRIVTPKKLKTITRDLDSRATRIRNDVDRNTADLVTHRTDIQQNITDINATKSNTATNTANITKILGNLANITPTTTAGRLVNSFTVPNTLHDKVSLKGEAAAGTYGYDVKVRGDILTVSDPTLQEVVVYRRDKNNKKLFSLEDVHKAKSHGSIYIENSRVHIANKDGKHIDVFEYDDTKSRLTFNKVSSLTLTNSYGKSIAINKDFLIVSNSEAKTVLVYSHVGELWLLVKKLNGAVGFGSRVSMSSKFIYVAQDKQVKVFNLNFTNVKTFTGTAAYKISAEKNLVALLDTGNNLIEVDKNNVPFTKLTIKSNCLDVHGLYLLLVDKTIPKVYVFGIYNKTGWFKTTQTKWAGIPDNKFGYVAYVVKGGDYQYVKPINTTNYYTKFANGGWVKNGTWGGKLYYTASEIGISKTDASKITITDSTDVSSGFGFVDAKGVVWIGIQSNGVGRLDTSTGKITITDRTDVRYGFCFIDGNGVVWIGTTSKGLGRLDTSTGKITITDSTDVTFGFVDANGVVWIGAGGSGVGRLDTSTGKITITESRNLHGGFGFVDAKGVVWIGTGNSGVGRLDTSTGKITITDSTGVYGGFGFVDDKGVVWIGTADDGLGRLDTSTGKITITDSTKVDTGFGFSDAQGVVWIGTKRSGLGRLDTSTGKITITDSTKVDYGFGFSEGNGVVWIGTYDKGLGFLTSGNDKLYLNTTSEKTYYGSKELTDSSAFDEIIEHLQPYNVVKPVIELPTRNIKISKTDIQEQPNKTGKYVSLLGTSTPRTPQAFDDAIFNIDAGYGDACALTANNVLVTNKTDSKLAVYDLKGNKLKEIQLTAGLGSVIDATEDEAIIGTETANTVDIVSLI